LNGPDFNISDVFTSQIPLLMCITWCCKGYELQSSSPNYYEILEIPRKSSALEIRLAFKKVSKKYHPDKNSAFDAAAKFQGIKRAYDVSRRSSW